jgi:uncharacterized repeat protein (TIGR03803 family)
MTIAGGSSDFGVIFSFDPVTSAYTKLEILMIQWKKPKGTLVQAFSGKFME